MKFVFCDKIIEYVTLLAGPEDAPDITIELMNSSIDDLKKHLTSFTMLREKIFDIED